MMNLKYLLESNKSKHVKSSEPTKSMNINTHTHTHTQILHEIVNFLDNCKESKKECECSAVLKLNSNETNELKKWSLLYQCDDNKYKINHMENTTLYLLDIQKK